MESNPCPFCREGDLDLVGLKNHLEAGDCETYNELPTIAEERKSISEKK